MENDWLDKLAALKAEMPSEPIGESETEIEINDSPTFNGRLDITFEKKGRGGKTATIIWGFDDSYPTEMIEELASNMKRKLGAGGSVRAGEILIQGDRRQDVLNYLKAQGFKARII